MQRCEVHNSQHLRRGGGKGGYYFDVTVALIANLHPPCFKMALSIYVFEGTVILVSTIHALQSGKLPIGAALAAAQVLDLIVFL
jgi:hypothetical protein